MAINSRGAGVHPKARRISKPIQGLSKNTCGLRSGFHDLPPIGGVVSAVDAASRKINEHIGLFQLTHPASEICTIPGHHAPRYRKCCAAQDYDGVTSRMKVPREDISDLAAASGNDNATW